MCAKDVTIRYGDKVAVEDVSIDVREHEVLALIGPSGCGKSTFLRALNRMNDTIDGVTFADRLVQLDGEAIYGADVDPVLVRRRVGMVFQRSNPFPKSVFDNVAYGLRIGGERDKKAIAAKVEQSLRQSALWDEVKERLDDSALSLSGGQQQRLCIARALAVNPEVLLMDEPASALDPIATAKLEDLVSQLRNRDDRDRHAQHAAGGARLAPHRFLLHGQARRGRRDVHDVHATHAARDRRLHHRKIRLRPGGIWRAARLRRGVRVHRTRGVHARQPARRPDDHDGRARQEDLHDQGFRHDGHPRPALGGDVHEGEPRRDDPSDGRRIRNRNRRAHQRHDRHLRGEPPDEEQQRRREDQAQRARRRDEGRARRARGLRQREEPAAGDLDPDARENLQRRDQELERDRRFGRTDRPLRTREQLGDVRLFQRTRARERKTSPRRCRRSRGRARSSTP